MKKFIRFHRYLHLFVLFSVSILWIFRCGTSGLKQQGSGIQAQLTYAKAVFDRKDYYKAKNLFTILRLNNPTGEIFEIAQFYLAECHYGLKEYIEAIAEYEKLIKSMPQSAFVDDAYYKIGMCYFKLSPGYALDQEYTRKAMAQFQGFIEEFPQSELRSEAEKRFKECREKLAKKEFKTGELYYKMGYYKAALLCFNQLLEEYHDTDYADDGLFWKGEAHRKLGEIESAELTYRALLIRYPRSLYKSKVEARLANLHKK